MSIQPLINDQVIWRARDLEPSVDHRSVTGIPTGFKDLDRLLYGGGWPRDALVEVFFENYGCGELRLLIPGLRSLLAAETRWIVWVNPPFIPYSPALKTLEIDVDRVLLVHPQNHKEALWATEKILESGSCSAALLWLSEEELNSKQLRRIQTRAKEGRVCTILFRPLCATKQFSPAELRLCIENKTVSPKDEITLSILKRKGGWQVNNLSLPLLGQPTELTREYLTTRWQQWRKLRNKENP